MNTTILDLSKLMPPPAEPLDIPSPDDWKRCERELTKLPNDYKEFIRTYGTGCVDDFLYICNPIAPNESLNIISLAAHVLEALEEIACESPDHFSMPRFPTPGGFLPFGGTDNGDNLFWVTEGEPDQWTVAVMGPRAPECFYHNAGMLDFLVAIIRRDVNCDVFRSSFPEPPPLTFAPIRE